MKSTSKTLTAASLLLLLSACRIAALAQTSSSTQLVTVPLRHHDTPSLIIQVTINGTGPYDLVVDTGTATTILDDSLFHQLHLPPVGSMLVDSPSAEKRQSWGYASEVAVGTAQLANVEVVSAPNMRDLVPGHKIWGILGENFLDHFDLLIDNHRDTLTLDPAGRLADNLTGDQVQLSTSTVFKGERMIHRPTVTLSLSSLGSEPVRVLLDSGTSILLLYTDQGLQSKLPKLATDPIRIQTVTGVVDCKQWSQNAIFGKTLLKRVPTVACEKATAADHDTAGVLPTALFKSIFISHRNSYIVLNPTPGQQTPVVPVATTASIARSEAFGVR